MQWNRYVSAREFKRQPSHEPGRPNAHVDSIRMVSERTQLIPTELRAYKRRWWILVVLSLAGFAQSSLWNAWGPISYAAEAALDWQDWNVATIPNVSNMGLVLTGIFMQYVVDQKGLRTSMLIATSCLLLGSGLWCIAVNISGIYGYVVILLGAVLNGISSTIYSGVPSLVSNLWFPPHQRSTATGFGITSSSFGSAVAFLTGPAISGAGSITGTSNISIAEKESLQTGILNFMYFDFGLSALVAILVVTYFPSMPTLPPSLSARAERMAFSDGLKHICKSASFWKVNLAYNIPNGVYNAWLSVLPITLKTVNISEAECGWIGFYSMVSGCLTAVIMARFTDIFRKRMKFFLMTMTTGALISFIFLLLMVHNYVPYVKAVLYVVNIAGGCMINGAIPMYYELACESSYPAQEGLVGACITVTNNLLGVMFYVVFFLPIQGTGWTTWALAGVLVTSIGCLFTIKEHYHRLDMDLQN